jgi:hypothetical protein
MCACEVSSVSFGPASQFSHATPRCDEHVVRDSWNQISHIRTWIIICMPGIVSIPMFSHAERAEDSTRIGCFQGKMIREGLLRWGLNNKKPQCVGRVEFGGSVTPTA